MTTARDRCWVLTDGKMGCRRQARGLAKALGLDFVEKKAHRRKPYYWLPARFHKSCLQQLHPESDTLTAPWPDYLIACGFRTVPVSLAIRAASARQTCCIHVQNPRVPTHLFDWVVAATHDQLQGNNVITHLGALHDLDRDALTIGSQAHPELAPHRGHLLSIVIGGNTARQRLSAPQILQMVSQLTALIQTWNGPCMLLSSRRTPSELLEQLQQLTTNLTTCKLYTPKSPQAYLAALDLAATIMVTEDSSSMVSEACFTGKPVYVLPIPGYRQRQKIKHLLDTLAQQGYCRRWQGSFETWSYAPLTASREAAQLLQARPSYR